MTFANEEVLWASVRVCVASPPPRYPPSATWFSLGGFLFGRLCTEGDGEDKYPVVWSAPPAMASAPVGGVFGTEGNGGSGGCVAGHGGAAGSVAGVVYQGDEGGGDGGAERGEGASCSRPVDAASVSGVSGGGSEIQVVGNCRVGDDGESVGGVSVVSGLDGILAAGTDAASAVSVSGLSGCRSGGGLEAELSIGGVSGGGEACFLPTGQGGWRERAELAKGTRHDDV